MEILPQIDPTWCEKILFVDGNSTDDTVASIEKWGHAEVFRQKKPGLAEAYWESFPRIDTDVVITFSPDGNSIAAAIPLLQEKMEEGYDMVIASRYLPGSGSDDDDVVTAFGNWMFTKIINIAFRGRYTDCLVMFRAYRRDLVERLEMDTHNPVFEQQLAIRCAVHKMKTCDIPVREPARIAGARKMQIIRFGLMTSWLIVTEWFRMIRKKLARENLSRARA